MRSFFAVSTKWSGFYALPTASLSFISLFYRCLVLVVGVLLLVPTPAYGGAAGPNIGLAQDLEMIIDWLTGPVATSAATFAMAGVLYGIVVRSQRGESIASLSTVAVSLILIVNIEDFMFLITVTSGGLM